MAQVETRVLDGRGIAGEVRQQVNKDVAAMKEKYGMAPSLAIVQVQAEKPTKCLKFLYTSLTLSFSGWWS